MNYHLFQVVNNWAGRRDGLDDVMEMAANRLIYVVFLAFAAICARALYERRVRQLVQVAAALGIALGAAFALSHANHEMRPFGTHAVHQLIAHSNDASLPSDHATAAFTIAIATGAFLNRWWGVLLAVCATVIGVARVWVGVHYPGDILAALLIAAAAVTVTHLAATAIDRVRRRNRCPAPTRRARPPDHLTKAIPIGL
jgi:undecaprenyl-diphosphatase